MLEVELDPSIELLKQCCLIEEYNCSKTKQVKYNVTPFVD